MTFPELREARWAPETALSAVEEGSRQERLALEWLLGQPGWLLLIRNYRRKTGEIDAILEQTLPAGEKELVFLEIRTRRLSRIKPQKSGRARALESITPLKQRRLRQTISQYLAGYRGDAIRCRVDLLLRDDEGEWVRLENAWLVQ
jgi:Holliday junction resolvase-like predicted endonuclease